MTPEKEILSYCIEHSTQPSEVAKVLEKHTWANLHAPHMLIGELEASLIRLIIQMKGVKKIAEFGTFSGYSALIMAESMPEDGTIFTVDINPHTTKVAKAFWDQSSHGKKIHQILKSGKEALLELTENGPFDLVFIDADKNGYPDYLLWASKNLTQGGVIISDNTLWSGKVLHSQGDAQTESIKKHNEMAKNLEGFTKCLLPIRDGMYILVKN
jgi:caffeoyl-CoA O-methyltransferase